jgi:hypothetical protein
MESNDKNEVNVRTTGVEVLGTGKYTAARIISLKKKVFIINKQQILFAKQQQN